MALGDCEDLEHGGQCIVHAVGGKGCAYVSSKINHQDTNRDAQPDNDQLPFRFIHLFMEYTLTVKFDRTNNTYRPGDTISGVVTVNFPDPSIRKCDIVKFLYRSEGVIDCQNKETHRELERIAMQLNRTLVHLNDGPLTKDKAILQEKNTFPFKFPFQPYQDRKIIETYVGVYVAIAYEIQIELTLMNGLTIRQVQPFFVQVPNQGLDRIKPDNNKFPRPENFRITPDKLITGQQGAKPQVKFRVSGVINSTVCPFTEDFHGTILVEECESDIRTIDLQLIRVERIENKLGKLQEATEIQLIQIIEGNATRGLEIPFYMIFPKYFSCPNFNFREFSVDFEVNLIMILYDGFKVTLNFPINVIRK